MPNSHTAENLKTKIKKKNQISKLQWYPLWARIHVLSLSYPGAMHAYICTQICKLILVIPSLLLSSSAPNNPSFHFGSIPLFLPHFSLSLIITKRELMNLVDGKALRIATLNGHKLVPNLTCIEKEHGPSCQCLSACLHVDIPGALRREGQKCTESQIQKGKNE